MNELTLAQIKQLGVWEKILIARKEAFQNDTNFIEELMNLIPEEILNQAINTIIEKEGLESFFDREALEYWSNYLDI